ncbi:Hypothetical predicted protein [Olea europaea subsp. europaea]|uniref:Uncharacterized protein n=1 Tax=Olea europaea subsp. europaea TaxID=158383 RepID=A0A8S0QXA6_OLEEU|nr:Hypothetical predicted protein [Olea europaea subsp. europaea]
MFPVEVQATTRIHHKYWTDKYSFYAKTYDSVNMMEVKRLKAEVSIVDEVIEALKVKEDEAESRIGLRTAENEKIKKEVHLCKVEGTNKEKVELQVQVVELTVEVANLRQQLNEVREAAVNEHGAHFRETDKYDGLNLY